MKIWTEISEERLAGNFAALGRVLAESSADRGRRPALLAVVKANAYGHGIDPCAAVLAKAGSEWLGVTDACEGERVREALGAAGIAEELQPKILVMCGTAGLPGEAERMVRSGLGATVWSAAAVDKIAAAAREADAGVPAAVHLEIDTGMSRQGVRRGAALGAVLEAVARQDRVRLEGVFTHFAATEVAGSAQTAAQQDRFEGAVSQVIASGLRPEWVHVGNTSYVDNGVDNNGSEGSVIEGDRSIRWLQALAESAGARAMVRSGLGLYGYVLPIEGAAGIVPGSRVGEKLLPVMTWKTRVIGVSEVCAGALVGYNGTFRAERRMRLALLPAGYADGLRRELSSSNARTGGWVMLRGARAPIVGRVSMNLTSVDVTDIAGVVEGDEAVLLGEGVTAEDHARTAGTIPYEILCGVRTSG